MAQIPRWARLGIPNRAEGRKPNLEAVRVSGSGRVWGVGAQPCQTNRVGSRGFVRGTRCSAAARQPAHSSPSPHEFGRCQGLWFSVDRRWEDGGAGDRDLGVADEQPSARLPVACSTRLLRVPIGPGHALPVAGPPAVPYPTLLHQDGVRASRRALLQGEHALSSSSLLLTC